MPPVSFSHAEMIRAGVPTYMFGKEGIHVPKYIKPDMQHFWEKKSIEQCSSFQMNRDVCQTKVDDLHCARNLASHLGE